MNTSSGISNQILTGCPAFILNTLLLSSIALTGKQLTDGSIA
ncbi:hypothetical protein Pan161_19810 [Gimesia algae]|uniref:Uncharacterized protein n=1 Tax=Gimesia algae TaxID=2527971 RepID=A0A517VBE8_9PLAN|nr:hypothetical protein Pan161_19810 [Gimesia algae]